MAFPLCSRSLVSNFIDNLRLLLTHFRPSLQAQRSYRSALHGHDRLLHHFSSLAAQVWRSSSSRRSHGCSVRARHHPRYVSLVRLSRSLSLTSLVAGGVQESFVKTQQHSIAETVKIVQRADEHLDFWMKTWAEWARKLFELLDSQCKLTFLHRSSTGLQEESTGSYMTSSFAMQLHVGRFCTSRHSFSVLAATDSSPPGQISTRWDCATSPRKQMYSRLRFRSSSALSHPPSALFPLIALTSQDRRSSCTRDPRSGGLVRS